MSVTAQRQDITDPDVVHRFAVQVEDVERLDHLYLLTIADIAGTNPKLWNAWKDQLLADLYVATRYALRAGLERPPHAAARIAACRDDGAEAARARRRRARRASSGSGRRFPTRASCAIGPDRSRGRRARSWRAPRPTRRSSSSTPSARGGSEVFVHAQDRDGLFAAITATLDRTAFRSPKRACSLRAAWRSTRSSCSTPRRRRRSMRRARRELEAELAGVLGEDDDVRARSCAAACRDDCVISAARRASSSRNSAGRDAARARLRRSAGPARAGRADAARRARARARRAHRDVRRARRGFLRDQRRERPAARRDARSRRCARRWRQRFGVEEDAPTAAAVSAST